jgi:hypothetical protein
MTGGGGAAVRGGAAARRAPRRGCRRRHSRGLAPPAPALLLLLALLAASARRAAGGRPVHRGVRDMWRDTMQARPARAASFVARLWRRKSARHKGFARRAHARRRRRAAPRRRAITHTHAHTRMPLTPAACARVKNAERVGRADGVAAAARRGVDDAAAPAVALRGHRCPSRGRDA